MYGTMSNIMLRLTVHGDSTATDARGSLQYSEQSPHCRR